MIPGTEIAMPAFHAHDDDFLYQVQHPTETPPSDTATAFKERIITRIQNGRTRHMMCQAPTVNVTWQAEFLRAFKLYYWPF